MKQIFTRNFKSLVLSAALLVLGGELCAQGSVTSMSLLGGNGQSGITFNVGSNQSVLIDSIGVALYAGVATQTVEVWYNPTAINGAPTINTTNNWVLHATITVNNVVGNFTNPNQFTLVLPTPISIPSGSTFGFYIGGSNASVAYTSWASTNQDVFTDNTVTLSTGQNIGYGGLAPSPGFHPRQFNGTIYYSNAYLGTIDLMPTALVTPGAPPACYTATEQVEVTIKNSGSDTIFFSTDSAVVSVTVSGPNPTATYSTVVNSGFLAPGLTSNVVVNPALNMSAGGLYSFSVFTSLAPADSNLVNDTLATVTRDVAGSGGTASISSTTICTGSSVILSLTPTTGLIQWQQLVSGVWTNISGATGQTAVISPTGNTTYRAQVCGTYNSNQVSVTTQTAPNPVVVNANRCGYGPVTMQAQGTGDLFWFPTPTSQTVLDTGVYFTDVIGTTTNYYVENQILGSTGTAGRINTLSSSGTGVIGDGLTFTVYNAIRLDSVAIYPIAVSGSPSLTVALQDGAGNTIVTSAPFTQLGFGGKMWIPLNFNIQPGNYRLVLASNTYSALYKDPSGNFPYVASTGDFQINGGWSTAAYNYFYDWRYHSLCVSQRVQVTANVAPAIPINATANDTNICSGDTITLTASSTSSQYNYLWKPNVNLSDTNLPVVQAWPSQTQQYVLYGLDNNNCAAYDTININVISIPAAIASATPSIICSGASSQLSVTNYVATSGYQYSWVASSGPNPPNVHNPVVSPTTGSTPTTYTYNMTVVDPPSGCSKSSSTTVTVNPGVTVNIGPDTVVCQFSNITINAGPSYSTYQWNNGEIGQIRFIGAIPFTQSVVVTVTNQYGCAAADSRLFTVLPRPNINLGPDRVICVNHILNVSAGTNYSSYLWYNGDTTSSTSIGPNATSGPYWVEVSNSAGCTNRDTIMVTVSPCTDITEYDQENDVVIYPNPNNGHFYLEINAAQSGPATLEVVNIQGQQLHSEQIQVRPDFRAELQLQDVPPGIYFVRVLGDEVNATKRVVVSR